MFPQLMLRDDFPGAAFLRRVAPGAVMLHAKNCAAAKQQNPFSANMRSRITGCLLCANTEEVNQLVQACTDVDRQNETFKEQDAWYITRQRTRFDYAWGNRPWERNHQKQEFSQGNLNWLEKTWESLCEEIYKDYGQTAGEGDTLVFGEQREIQAYLSMHYYTDESVNNTVPLKIVNTPQGRHLLIRLNSNRKENIGSRMRKPKIFETPYDPELLVESFPEMFALTAELLKGEELNLRQAIETAQNFN